MTDPTLAKPAPVAAAAHLRGALAVRVFLVFALAYFLSFALRSVNAVIAPELMADLSLTNAQLGSLSSAYFLSFAALQLPLGIWLDRFGARRVEAVLLLFAAAGCALFALAHDVALLWLARALIGMGVASCLMAALKSFRFWFEPRQQYPLASWMLVAGTLGALATTVPVQWLMPLIGWRGVFWITAGLLLLSSLALLLVLPRNEEHSSSRQSAQQAGSSWSGYTQVFASPYFRRFALVSITSHATFVSLQSLWAGPWFVQVLGFTPLQSAQVLFVFNLVLMGGYLFIGWLMPRLDSRGIGMDRVILVGTCCVIAVELAIASTQATWAWALWLVLAIVSTFYTTVQTHVSLSFPAAFTGRAYTAYNLLIFSGMFLAQWLFGVVIDLFKDAGHDTPHAFRYTLASWACMQLAALAIFFFWRVPAPSGTHSPGARA